MPARRLLRPMRWPLPLWRLPAPGPLLPLSPTRPRALPRSSARLACLLGPCTSTWLLPMLPRWSLKMVALAMDLLVGWPFWPRPTSSRTCLRPPPCRLGRSSGPRTLARVSSLAQPMRMRLRGWSQPCPLMTCTHCRISPPTFLSRRPRSVTPPQPRQQQLQHQQLALIFPRLSLHALRPALAGSGILRPLPAWHRKRQVHSQVRLARRFVRLMMSAMWPTSWGMP
jgi:hypothetical protein